MVRSADLVRHTAFQYISYSRQWKATDSWKDRQIFQKSTSSRAESSMEVIHHPATSQTTVFIQTNTQTVEQLCQLPVSFTLIPSRFKMFLIQGRENCGSMSPFWKWFFLPVLLCDLKTCMHLGQCDYPESVVFLNSFGYEKVVFLHYGIDNIVHVTCYGSWPLHLVYGCHDRFIGEYYEQENNVYCYHAGR